MSNWCFTIWQRPKVNLELVEFMVYQKEKCELTGRNHWQGYIEFKKDYKLFQVKSLFKCKEMFVDKAQKSRHANILYCSKSRTYDGERFMFNANQIVTNWEDELDDVFDLKK